MMTREELLRLLPHRAPFLFVDDVVEIGSDAIRTCFRAEPSLPFFAGHFPGHPVMPGVLLCECCLQAGAVLLAGRTRAEGSIPVATRILEAKFKRMVRPGDMLTIDVTLDEELGGAYFMSGKATVAGDTAVRCKFAVTRVEADRLS